MRRPASSSELLYPVHAAHRPLRLNWALVGLLGGFIFMLGVGLLMSTADDRRADADGRIGSAEITVVKTDFGTSGWGRFAGGVTAVKAVSRPALRQPALRRRLSASSIPTGSRDLAMPPASTLASADAHQEIQNALETLADVPEPHPSPVGGGGALAGSNSYLDQLIRAAEGASHVVYLVDRSGSMGDEARIYKAVLLLAEAINALPPSVLMQVVLFDDQLEVFDFQSGTFRPLKGRLRLVTNRRNDLHSAASQVTARGGTEPEPAVRVAAKALRDAANGVMLIISDGEYSSGEISRVKAANHSNSRIACIVVGSSATGAKTLRTIAGQNGGSFTAR